MVPVVGISAYAWPAATLFSWIGFGVAFPAMKAVWTFREPGELIPALARSAAGLMVYAVGMAVGLLVGA